MLSIKLKTTLLSLVALAFSASVYAQPTSNNLSEKENFVKVQEELAKKNSQDLTGIFKGVDVSTDKPNIDGGKAFIKKNEDAMQKWQEHFDNQGFLENFEGADEDTIKNVQVARGFMDAHEKRVQNAKKQFAEKGYLEGFDEKAVEEQTKKFRAQALEISKQSNTGMLNALSEDFGIDFNGSPKFNPNEIIEPEILKGIFITFDMSNAEIKSAMDTANAQGASIYLKGMHKDDMGIHDTIKRLRFIGRELKTNPDVRFKPRYFEQYNVKVAPTIIYRKDDRALLASGIMNVNWLADKMKRQDENGFLGFYGDTRPVVEEDIRITFKKRMAAIDWEGKKDEIVGNFWKKQKFNNLPRADKNETWYIDVSATATKDVINPRGTRLATKGETLNPISRINTNLTVFIFNPIDTKQLEWVTQAYSNDTSLGKKMIIFSQISQAKGWDHLSALRKHFGREIYQLPKEMVSTFDLTGLPARVSTDLKANLMKIEQYNINGEAE